MQQQVEEGRRLVQLLARMCQDAAANERRQGGMLVKAAGLVLELMTMERRRPRAAAEVAVEVVAVAVVAVPLLHGVAVPVVVAVAVPPHRSSGCLPMPSLVQVSFSSIGPRAGHPYAGHPYSIVMQLLVW